MLANLVCPLILPPEIPDRFCGQRYASCLFVALLLHGHLVWQCHCQQAGGWIAFTRGTGLVALDGGRHHLDAFPRTQGLAGSRQALRAGFYQLATLALLGMVLNQTLGYYAAQTLGATEIGLMMGLTPLMTVLLSIWLLRERPTWGALLGGLISILGLTILLGQGDPSRLFTQGIHIGSVYMLLSAGTYALYSVLLKKWDLGLDNWSMLYGQVLCSLLFLTPFYLLVDGQWPDGRALWLILYAGIPTSALSPWLWMQGIALLGASRTAIFMNLLPVMTAALAISWLGEKLTSYHLIGGGLTLLGVLLAQLLVQPVVLRRRARVALASCRED